MKFVLRKPLASASFLPRQPSPFFRYRFTPFLSLYHTWSLSSNHFRSRLRRATHAGGGGGGGAKMATKRQQVEPAPLPLRLPQKKVEPAQVAPPFGREKEMQILTHGGRGGGNGTRGQRIQPPRRRIRRRRRRRRRRQRSLCRRQQRPKARKWRRRRRRTRKNQRLPRGGKKRIEGLCGGKWKWKWWRKREPERRPKTRDL